MTTAVAGLGAASALSALAAPAVPGPLAEMLSAPFMQRALIVAVLVGLIAPIVGTYLVQRGLALLGDGIGHISLTGVALGWLAGSAAGTSPGMPGRSPAPSRPRYWGPSSSS
ncbi:zinc/manganese ABC superfamily ATP binding cassette transporter permease [Actinomyces denticolens]|nr:zinc/manganese ABC superfamily ATP binding cassette transporter permease [Actinomyces denticolens]